MVEDALIGYEFAVKMTCGKCVRKIEETISEFQKKAENDQVIRDLDVKLNEQLVSLKSNLSGIDSCSTQFHIFYELLNTFVTQENFPQRMLSPGKINRTDTPFTFYGISTWIKRFANLKGRHLATMRLFRNERNVRKFFRELCFLVSGHY